ncbi:hypothetical protein A0J61_01312 [Choanephora cucurbitarum]|uniref:C2H2-type domain-containing protein n=1 Tax=Choanephora cucurbitarum TaxID=101091 RepID=A0A1C7NNB7_9FUNG|nr:hypothetical protein A0J61_01312 [Choanephora cucurbitarum]
MDLGTDSISLPCEKNRNLLSSTDNLQSSPHPIEPDMMSIESPASKRYSLSQDIKNSFYAIRHIKEEESNNENNMPVVSGKKTTSTASQRGRKRAVNYDTCNKTSQTQTSQRKKQRQHNKTKTVLYQTCTSIWPEQHTSHNLSHDYIKSLSELVKIRLSQAKFKLLAQLDKDHALYSCLAETLIAPSSSLYHCNDETRMRLIGKQNKSTISVVGSSKNLFTRNKARRRLSTTYTEAIFEYSPSSTTAIDDYGFITSPSRQIDTNHDYHTSTKSTKKKRTPKASNAKPRRVTTPKRKSAAADVVPITLSDGSSVYVCEPCNKKYKNRNGLAYHLERCKNKSSEKEENKESSSQTSLSQPTTNTSKKEDDADGDDEQEDEDEEEEDDAHSESEQHQMGKDLLQSLLEAQANDRLLAGQTVTIANASTSFSQFNDELFHSPSVFQQEEADNTDSQTAAQETTPSKREDEDDGLCSVHTAEEPASSSNLHIWDDFNISSGFENTTHDQWKLPDEEDPFSTNYETDLPSSSWQVNDINLFSQPPSLLFSDTTLNSNMDDTKPLLEELTPMSTSEMMASCADNASMTPLANVETPSQTAHTPLSQSTPDGALWFQFANFDDDYQQQQKV